ncbi:TlpA family protein disulfide reductase [Paenibacillus yanchengensis]|uniref:TlpA family protein disulfide reductase n=1 Tax=Paenibacillus yanchengensis TaxID=2035833 RepID=A0ABW4YF09_9BACL
MKEKLEISQNKINELLKTDFTSSHGGSLEINKINGEVILLFTSLYCTHCIDLLPELNEINSLLENSSMVLFTDGKIQEIREMVEFFNWTIPVVSYDEYNLNNYIPDIKLPFMLVLDGNKNVLSHGTIYNKTDSLLFLNSSSQRVK